MLYTLTISSATPQVHDECFPNPRYPQHQFWLQGKTSPPATNSGGIHCLNQPKWVTLFIRVIDSPWPWERNSFCPHPAHINKYSTTNVPNNFGLGYSEDTQLNTKPSMSDQQWPWESDSFCSESKRERERQKERVREETEGDTHREKREKKQEREQTQLLPTDTMLSRLQHYKGTR